MPFIQPINPQQQVQVIATTQRLIAQAAQRLAMDIASIPVSFDLRGRAAGMYRSHNGVRTIRYNPWIFAKYFDDNLANTVPHEVAHYVCDFLHGLKNIRPHGKEWLRIMNLLNAVPQKKHSYNLDGIPQRQQQRYPYRCACREYQLGSIRHRRIQSGQGFYLCRHCETNLVRCDDAVHASG